tara:strand:+ start:1540 stop:1869 length:330 start_codon:yes stop_codon:yes gene_type:complete
MSSKAKIFCLVNENAIELDLLVYWDSSDGIGGWTVRMTEIFSDESKIQSYLLLDQFGGIIRLETVLEFFAQDYLPKYWYQDFSMWEFGVDHVKFATTTIPLKNGEYNER